MKNWRQTLAVSGAVPTQEPAGLLEPSSTLAGLDETFADLLASWKSDTQFSSVLEEKIAHPAFLRIVSLGMPAFPLVLEEARRGSLAWFRALDAIAGANPAEQIDDVDAALAVWERWWVGRASG